MRIAAAHVDQRVMVVSHGGVIGHLLHRVTASRRFARETRPRLEDLALAVRAAEQMPPQRRRVAHKAVSAELDRVELTLLDHLGVGRTV